MSTFDDGPKVGNVFITTVSLFGPKGQRVTSATFRSGRVKEVKPAGQPDSAYVFQNQTVLTLKAATAEARP